MSTALEKASVLVVGAGIMGSGIAQVAAQAGHRVLLYDAQPGAAEQARARLGETLDKLAARGKFTLDEARAIVERIDAVAALEAGAEAGLVIEAIVENADTKRELLRDLEDIVADDCLLASNTSSISITALANGLRHPGRLAGMHFFNPVPLMKLVEVVSGLHTDEAAADAIFELAERWGKTAVHARSTPGFIVNRIARPFYAESLRLLEERAATPQVLDACLRGAGFRMGPCELMDLIGLDTNFAVTQSVFEASFFDRRYQPSLLQREMVAGGLLGRKSGRGFYDYGDDAKPASPEYTPPREAPPHDSLTLRGQGPLVERFAIALKRYGCRYETVADSKWTGLQVDGARLRLTDGRCAAEHGRNVAVFDLPLGNEDGAPLAWSPSARAAANWIETAPQWLTVLGFAPQHIADVPGLVVARSVAMLINEAADAVQQGVCSEDGADLAMKLGVNYPAGPFEWLAAWNAADLVALLDRLDEFYRGERYRVSPRLRQHAWQSAGCR
jgi:3-hydroxybutyryl-CoA dehydrogenase